MPRTARIVIPNYPHHVIQRGHNRQTVFAGDDDFRYYLDTLAEWKERLECEVYAFCLMTNHIHLVVNPGADAENLGRLMKHLAAKQTRYVNRLEQRSGTLWEGRFKSSLIETNAYLLACCRYVEMNPVLAGLSDDPSAYPWSSCRSKTHGKSYGWLDEDSHYRGLGITEEDRREKYRDFLRESISDQEKERILGAVQRGQLTGGSAFVDEIEKRLDRRVDFRGRGRPRKTEK